MTEVISVKFKNRGKCYFFDPNGLEIAGGEKVIVETSKGLEIADCCYGNHEVDDTAVVQPLRPVIRVATQDDIRVAEVNKQREKEAFEICQKKIEEHGLDMKLVDVECNFEGNKTMFFFTSDGRVDFRELVKDLAGIFRNRIELRQIGVRDEAKMLGGIGICGRPYCCNQFLDDFQPVSTKMAKVQLLSLNPTKISGSCGRLMCCLRYEQDAYEELIKKVPKQGAFVETKDGYGNVVQVNLLRQTVKVKLDEDSDDTIRSFKANELATVPGGRPKEGEPLPSVLKYVPEEEDEAEEVENEWMLPTDEEQESEEPVNEERPVNKKSQNRRRRGRNKGGSAEKAVRGGQTGSQTNRARPQKHSDEAGNTAGANRAEAESGGHGIAQKKQGGQGKTTVKPVKVETKPHENGAAASADNTLPRSSSNHHRRYYHGKPKTKTGGSPKKPEAK